MPVIHAPQTEISAESIPDAILGKPGRLTEEEYEVIKTHPRIGSRMLAGHPLASLVDAAVLMHHETPNGKGYPLELAETNPVRVVDVFVDELDLGQLEFDGVDPAATGRPAYHPAVLLKLYIYGYLNRIQSSRRLEREAQRNVDLMWLTGRLTSDFKTIAIANFRKDNGKAIRRVCRQFVVLCQQLGLFSEALVAIDGSKFKAVNHRDRNFTSEQKGPGTDKS